MAKKEFGEFWRRKISTFVYRLDTDVDGIVSENDFKRLSERFVTIGKLDGDVAKNTREKVMKIWYQYWAEASKTTPITAGVYCDMLESQGKEAISKSAGDFFGCMFDAIDSNDDGFVSMEEYELLFRIMGVENEEAVADHVFLALNTKKNGKLSRAEFLVAGEEFGVSEDESKPSKLIFGPLI